MRPIVPRERHPERRTNEVTATTASPSIDGDDIDHGASLCRTRTVGSSTKTDRPTIHIHENLLMAAANGSDRYWVETWVLEQHTTSSGSDFLVAQNQETRRPQYIRDADGLAAHPVA